MSLFRKFFYKKPPDGLLEISERVFVFDSCFTTDVMGESEYKVYVAGIVSQLREQFHDASFMVFNFREGEQQSQIANILSEFDMTVMDYPRHYEGCPLLTMEMIHHFLRSSESWLSLDQQNVLLMHCERGGWCVLAFMLAALLIYRKQFTGEQKTLDMIYKQAPRELVNLLSPLNPMPSQMRYLQYVSRRNVGSEWPPFDRTLTLDCVILRTIPNFDGEGGCRPIFRIYGQDPFMASDRTTKVLFSTPKRSKTVKLYRQADCELVKIDINCRILGDVVLECISLDEDLDREEMMFRVMFNTAFIRSNILMLNRDEIDILWDAKNRFSKDFRAEVLLSEMNAASSVITVDLVSSGDKDGLPEEAFAKVQEFFNTVDWLDPKADAALHALQQITSSNIHQEKLDVVSPEKIDIYRSPPPSPHIVLQGPSQPKADAALHALQQITSSNIHLENLDVVSPEKIDIYRSPPPSPHIVLQGPSQPKVVFESSSQTVGITSVLHDHDEFESSEATQYVKNSSYTESKAASPRPPLTPSSFLAKSVPSTPPPPPPPPPPRSGHLLSSSSPPPPPSTPLAAARIPMLQSLTPITPPVEERAKSPPSPTLLASSSPMKKSTPPPPPPPPPINKSCPPPPPPPPPATSSAPQPPPIKKSVLPPPPPPPRPGRTPSAPPPPPPPQNLSTHSNGSKGIGHGAIPPPPPNVQKVGPPPPPSAPKVGPPPLPNGLKTTPASLGVKGRTNTRSSTHSPKKTSLKPLHWVKVTRAMQGSLWAETQKSDDASKPPEFDMSELESLFSAAVPNSELRGSTDKSRGRSSTGHKPEKVHLIDLRRTNNCEIMLTKVKMPLPDLMSTVLALDDSLLDADQVDNLIKFCPTKEEMDLLKGFSGNKELLGKCEQYFLELMKVPRVESKLRVFSFKIQFQAQVADLSGNLNTVNSASSEIRNSAKLKRIMQTILSLGNALNQGTARGSAIGFRLDSLLKLTDTRARNNKMTLMHYLCKVVADKLPELLDFPKDLVSLEPASKIQLKTLAEEMQAISKGLEKVEEELTASENDGPVSDMFRKTLKEFLKVAEGEVRSLASLYSNVGRNADALALYFGEDPARCPFEQVISTLLNFVRMFVRALDENCKQLELEKKKAEKEAETERIKLNGQRKEPELLRSQSRGTRSR